MKLLLAAIVPIVVQSPAQLLAPAPRLSGIEIEILSWGRPMSHWSIDAQGNGRLTRPEPGVFEAKRMVTRRFSAGTAGFRKIRVLIGGAERRAGHTLPCINRITDAPYGTVRWTPAHGRATQLRFDTGCRDRIAAEVTVQLAKAEAQIAAWAAADREPEINQVETPR